MNNRKTVHLLIIVFLFLWAFELVVAKTAKETFAVSTIIMMKFSIGILVIAGMNILKREKLHIRKADILLFAGSSITGQVLGAACQYTAMDYMPVSMITALLALTPLVAIVMEWILYRKRPNRKMLMGSAGCIMGISLLVGVNIADILNGQLVGYLLALGSVFIANVYNFILKKLSGNYTTGTLTFNQMMCTLLIVGPAGLMQFPGIEAFQESSVLMGMLYMGIMCAGIGHLLYIHAIKVLGPTTIAVYYNLLPVTTAFCSCLFLDEIIRIPQVIGIGIAIASGAIIIIEKARREAEEAEKEEV